jgi:hypothetical protein
MERLQPSHRGASKALAKSCCEPASACWEQRRNSTKLTRIRRGWLSPRLGPMRPAYNGDEQSDASRHDRSSAEAPEHPGRVVVSSLEDHGGFGSARTVARFAGLRMSKKEAPRRALDHLAKGSRPWGQKAAGGLSMFKRNRARPPQGQGHNSRVMGAGSRRLSRRALSRVTARRTRRSARRIRRRRIMTWPRWCSCASRRPHPPGRDALGRQGKRSTFHPSVAAIIGHVVVVLTFPALIVARADREAAQARLGDRVSRILRAPTVDCAAFRPCLRLSGDALLSAGATLGSALLSRPCEGSASFVDRSQRDIHNRVGILDHVSEALSDKAALDRR